MTKFSLKAALLLSLCTACCSTPDGEFNRGIGVYPGNPAEDFSPRMVKDDEYRNIALHRAAFNSSSYDYNLTANLLTDGIVETDMPKYLEFVSSEGKPMRRMTDWLIDGHPYTRMNFYGDKVYMQFNLCGGWTEEFDNLKMYGLVSYLEENADGSHELRFFGSNDGKEWTLLHKIGGRNLIGKVSKPRKHTDPDKADALGVQLLPTRQFDIDFDMSEAAPFSHIRIEMDMKGAEQWIIANMDLYKDGKPVNLISSKHFSSVWKSGGNETEWVCVDLGHRAKFDKVVMKWLRRPTCGVVQISDDRIAWKDVATLTEEHEKDSPLRKGTEVVAAKGKGRYVRVLMCSDDSEPVVMTEMEIWGKGGLTPAAKPSPAITENEMNLAGGNWKLIRASETDATGAEISSEGFLTDGWITATVPGTVLSSFVNIGAVPDPNHSDNIMHISDSYFNSDFWYRREFEVNDDFAGDKLWLDFDGINWKAEIYLNGGYIGRIDGAFIRGRFDISDKAVAGNNILAVRIIKNANPGAVKEKNEENTGRNGGILGYDNPTFHASIGWDWITTTRGRNIGIWNDVRIVKEGVVSIDSPYTEAVLPLPDTTSAVLTSEVIVKNSSKEAVTGVLEGRIGDIRFSKDVTLAAGEEKTVRFESSEYPQLVMQNPALWWPNGYGEQNLYDAEYTFRIGDSVSDREEYKVGIRQVEAKEIDSVLHLYINGRRFIGRGGNWGFSESNLNYRGREYDIAAELHANMNFNIMRNWVGQTGDMELYEACDRHGIMVWQDFWLANPADGPDPVDEEMFLENARDFVKRIRRYPSMVIYCGRNEGYPPAAIDAGLREIIRELHPEMHYIPSSADDCVSGHGPYNARSPKVYFSYPKGNDMFHSERGMPSVMTYESMCRTFSPQKLWPQSVDWYQHDYTLSGAQRCTSFNEIISAGYGESDSAKEFAEKAQFVNYDGYRAMFESRSIKRKGLLLWMSHPCWPSMTWQTYDWYFETNGSYFGSKKGAEPLHLQWNSATDYIELVNYNGRDRKNLTAKALIMNLDGTTVWEKEIVTDSNEDTTTKCFKVEFPENCSQTHFIKLYLLENGKTISDNFYINGTEYGNHQAMSQIAKADVRSKVSMSEKDGIWKGSIVLENRSDVPAIMIRLNVTGRKDGQQILPTFYEDNYFSMMPGEVKTVDLKFYDADTRGNTPKVTVTGYNL